MRRNASKLKDMLILCNKLIRTNRPAIETTQDYNFCLPGCEFHITFWKVVNLFLLLGAFFLTSYHMCFWLYGWVEGECYNLHLSPYILRSEWILKYWHRHHSPLSIGRRQILESRYGTWRELRVSPQLTSFPYKSFSSRMVSQTAWISLLCGVTHLVDSNLPLASKQKFRFGLTRSGQARPIRNFCFDVNRRLESTRCVTLYIACVILVPFM